MKSTIQFNRIHASSVHRWLSCPQQMIYESLHADDSIREYRHVGAVVGDMVHAKVTGFNPQEDPRPIMYDHQTRNMSEAKRQSKNIAAELIAYMDAKGIDIVAKEKVMAARMRLGKSSLAVELRGTADLLCMAVNDDGHEEYVVLDIKTGTNMPENSMVQVAVYAYLISVQDFYASSKNNFSRAGVLFGYRCKSKNISQRANDGLKPPVYETRPFDTMAEQGKQMVMQAARLASGSAQAFYNPSKVSCGRCANKHCDFRFYTKEIANG